MKRLVLTASILSVCALALAACGDLTSGEIDRGVKTLESVAAEGRLIAGETGHDRIKTTFTRVRAGELADEADHEAEKLADATPAPGQAGRRDAAVALAQDLSDALGELGVFPEDEAKAGEAEQMLREAGAKLSKLLEHP